jgi:hypothetical protein
MSSIYLRPSTTLRPTSHSVSTAYVRVMVMFLIPSVIAYDLSLWNYFVFYVGSFRGTPGENPEIGHDRLLTNQLQFIAHKSYPYI